MSNKYKNKGYNQTVRIYSDEELASMTYSEKLSDVRWRQLALDVKDRDGNVCVFCESPFNLQVHHEKYVGKHPWNTPSEYLITVCRICHAKEHEK